MGTILVVDDLQEYIDDHLHRLQASSFTVVTAMNLDEVASKYIEYRDDLAGIILDGCVPGTRLNTVPFIRDVKADLETGLFKGFLIAASVDPNFRRQMVAAGCTHESEKLFAADLLLELLG